MVFENAFICLSVSQFSAAFIFVAVILWREGIFLLQLKEGNQTLNRIKQHAPTHTHAHTHTTFSQSTKKQNETSVSTVTRDVPICAVNTKT